MHLYAYERRLLPLIFSLLCWAVVSACAPKLIGVSALTSTSALSSGSSSGSSGSSSFSITSAGLKGFQAAGPIDFDHDALLDIVVAGVSSDNIIVKTSDGAGGWAADASFTPTAVPIGITVGDLNHDGNPDAFVTLSTGGVDVFIRTSGNFNAAVHYAAGTATAGITIGDFNKDGSLDIVCADFGGDQIDILLGNAALGTLGAATTYATGTAPIGITSYDFDHDGNLDVVYTNSSDDTIAIRLGDGTGGFGAATTYAVGTTPVGIAHGDFNRDGNEDIVVANYGSANVSVLLGTGTGTFGAATNTSVGTNPVNVAVGDLDVDGIADLVVANYGSNNASKLIGTGTGTFGAAVNTATSTGPLSVVIADFDRSGEPDGAITEQADTTPTLITGTDPGAPGTFTDAGGLSLAAGSYPLDEAVGDFDNDGDLDMAVTDFALDKIRVFFNDGTGSLTMNQDIALGGGYQPAGIATADMDNDGDLDLVVAQRGNGTVEVFKNNGAGTFGAAFSSVNFNNGAGGNAWDVVLADFDHDGDIDVVCAGVDFGDESIMEIYTNDGTGAISLSDRVTPAAVNTTEDTRDVAMGDIDNDGDIDIVYTDHTHGNILIALNDGTGNFAANPTVLSSGGAWAPQAPTLIDINRDGNLDLLLGQDNASREGSIMIGDGAGSFNAAVVYDAAGSPTGYQMIPLDIDFDGDFDFFLNTQYSGSSNGGQMLRGDASTGMTFIIDYPVTCSDTHYGVAADFNRDGRLDVAISCNDQDVVELMTAD